MFCYITKNWQGKPLVDIQTVIELIGSTVTITGLQIFCVIDDTENELTKKVSDVEFDSICTAGIAPFESWNYYLFPH